jgi:hypothetical protein
MLAGGIFPDRFAVPLERRNDVASIPSESISVKYIVDMDLDSRSNLRKDVENQIIDVSKNADGVT